MKKLALLLALCLTVTMLSGIGNSEAILEDGASDIQIDELLPDGELPEADLSDDALALEIPDSGDGEALLVGDDPDVAIDDMDLLITDGLALEEGDGIAMEEQSAEESADENTVESAGQAREAGVFLNASEPHTDPDGPQLENNIMTVGVDDFFYMNPTMPDGSDASTVTYMSSDSTIAKVYKSGRVTGVSEGFACITAVSENGCYSECFVYVKKAPVMVSFGVENLVIGVDEEYKQLKLIFGEPAEEYGGTYTIESETKSIVKVKKGNVIKGLKAGTGRIKVQTYNGLKGILKVIVKKKPSKIQLSVDKATLGVGESGKVTYTLPDNTGSSVTFTSDDPSVVSVDSATGEITGLAVGQTKIRGTTFNGKSSSVTVKVLPAPTSIDFDDDVLKVALDMKLAIPATVNEGSAGAITYAVKNTTLATCDGKTVTGVKKGSTVLTATTYNGISATCKLQVVAKPTKVTLPYTKLEIGVGQSVTLQPDVGDSASTYTFSSSNSKIVKVSKDGKITGVKTGTAKITVKTFNGKKCKLEVKVLKAPKSVTLKPASLELSIGESAELKWSFPKGTAAGVTFKSSDSDVAAVDPETGVVTGVSAGDAVITVTTTNGKKDKTKVTVLSSPYDDEPTGEYIEIGVSQKYQLKVDASDVKYASANKKIATVSAKGEVLGVSKGETTVTATSGGKTVAQITVSVLAAPKSVKFDPDSMTLAIGDSVLLMPEITAGSATGFTYSSSDPEVASVSKDGTLTAQSGGKATITVTTSNKLTAKLKVTVDDPLYPESAELTNAPSSMKAGESLQLEWKASPSGAIVSFEWDSSDNEVAYVDGGAVLHAVSAGSAKITAKAKQNSDITLSFKVKVEGEAAPSVVLTIPERITGTSGIQKNLQKIDAIRACAISQIEALKADGKITSADASKRKNMVNNAFKDYAFPWMTEKTQPYWKKENSEGGAKDFKKGKIYYGVPYTSGSGSNREYNVKKLLNGGYYYDSGEGYYILDQSKFSGRKYRGNDCSCFVDAAIWGTNSSHSNDRTADIAKSSAYKTIKSYDNLRTGDLICKGGNHVVMFLYYANAEKTKIMIIENGGIEPGTNTVHCMIMNVKWYTSRSYKIRRLKSLG